MKRPRITDIGMHDATHWRKDQLIGKAVMGIEYLRQRNASPCSQSKSEWYSARLFISGGWRTFAFVKLDYIPKKFK